MYFLKQVNMNINTFSCPLYLSAKFCCQRIVVTTSNTLTTSVTFHLSGKSTSDNTLRNQEDNSTQLKFRLRVYTHLSYLSAFNAVNISAAAVLQSKWNFYLFDSESLVTDFAAKERVWERERVSLCKNWQLARKWGH